MKLKHDLKMYPPRIIMTVIMKSSAFVVPVNIEGCSTDDLLNLDLAFPLGIIIINQNKYS